MLVFCCLRKHHLHIYRVCRINNIQKFIFCLRSIIFHWCILNPLNHQFHGTSVFKCISLPEKNSTYHIIHWTSSETLCPYSRSLYNRSVQCSKRDQISELILSLGKSSATWLHNLLTLKTLSGIFIWLLRQMSWRGTSIITQYIMSFYVEYQKEYVYSLVNTGECSQSRLK